MIHLLLLTTLSSAPAPVPKPAAARPTGFPPAHREAVYKDGALLVRVYIPEYRTEKRTVSRTGPDGKVIQEEQTVTIPIFREIVQKIDARKATVYRANGKDVEEKELATLLAQPTMVFIAAEPRKLDPFFLQFLADDALIVVPPPPPVAPGPLPAPVPLPQEKPS